MTKYSYKSISAKRLPKKDKIRLIKNARVIAENYVKLMIKLMSKKEKQEYELQKYLFETNLPQNKINDYLKEVSLNGKGIAKVNWKKEQK